MEILQKVKDLDDVLVGYRFVCPGCAEAAKTNKRLIPVHYITVARMARFPESEGRPIWEFNGNEEKPTFTPSIKCEIDYFDHLHVCHSYVTDGQIQFLHDCTHPLKGQTVPLPEYDIKEWKKANQKD